MHLVIFTLYALMQVACVVQNSYTDQKDDLRSIFWQAVLRCLNLYIIALQRILIYWMIYQTSKTHQTEINELKSDISQTLLTQSTESVATDR